MIESGDVYLRGDFNRRVAVLGVSVGRLNQLAGRVVVAPELLGPPDDVVAPWRIHADRTVFALELIRSLPTDRLLQCTGRIFTTAATAVRRALRHIV